MVKFYDLEIPDEFSIYVGSQPNEFAEVSRQQMAVLDKYTGIEPNYAILEIGCGPGKLAIPLSKRLTTGRYLGLDISPKCIDWCGRNITPIYPNTSFAFADIKSSMYNPDGALSDADYDLPVEDQSVDLIILFSVFTHILQEGVKNYLHEFRRVLKPGGKVLATWFILSSVTISHCRQKAGPIGNFRFEHPISEGCAVNDKDHPLGTVGYTLPWIIHTASQAGLEVEYIVNAYWSGAHPGADTGQDLTVLRRS